MLVIYDKSLYTLISSYPLIYIPGGIVTQSTNLTPIDRIIDHVAGEQLDYIIINYPAPENLPNDLVKWRLKLFPLQIFFLIMGLIYNSPLAALGALIVLCVQAMSDLLDGYWARKYSYTSDEGALLDPVADKLMVLPTLLLLAIKIGDTWALGLVIAMIILEVISTIWYLYHPGGSSGYFGKAKLWVQVLTAQITLINFMKLTQDNREHHDAMILIVTSGMYIAIPLALASLWVKFRSS